jgi:hypothetical protein
LLVWVQVNADSTDELWTARYTRGIFTGLGKLGGMSGDAVGPSVQISPGGDGYVVWNEVPSGSVRSEVWISRWGSSSNAWGTPRKIAGSDAVFAMGGRIGLDADGRGALVWSQAPATDGGFDYMSFSPWSARLDSSSLLGWGTPARLAQPVSGLPDVSVDPNGNGLAVWQRFVDQTFDVVASTYNPTRGWSDPNTLSLSRSDFALGFPRLTVNPMGDGVAMWTQVQGGSSAVWGATYNLTNAQWAPATKLSPQDSVLPAWAKMPMGEFPEPMVDFALDATGGGFTVWADFASGDVRTIWARRVRPNQGFELAVPVATDNTPAIASRAEIALDGLGDGLVIWDKQVTSQYEVWTSRVE